ncbi:MAG: PqqD family protein [Bacteroidales bacterium]|nr:PqqD family protein [Bacteroidales bacterium]
MKTKEYMVLRTICGQKVLSAEGAKAINMSSIISLNDTAAYLWESVAGKDFTADDLKKLLLEKYEVDEPTAAKDAEALAAKWLELGIVD